MIGATVRRTTSEVLVGRAAELAEVRHVLDNAVAGQPGCLLIGGEAGVGKTTLLGAPCSTTAEQAGVRVVRSSCVDLHGGDAPLLPVVEALRRLAADLGADEWDAAVGDARPQLARLLPELGDSGGADGGATALLGALLTLVGRLAAPAPLLLAVDDVHWADPSTLDLLAFLARNLRDERVLLVATFRDDEPERGGVRHWLAEVARLPLAVRVDLGRLSRADTGELMAAIGGRSADAQLVERIYARSAGNPFAAEELLAAATAGAGALPPTLADLLTGRLAALGDDAHGLLRVAAAVGDRVDHPLLEAIAGLDADALTAALREAGDHRLLIGDADGDRYAFRHPLIAEAAYAELLPGERRRVHAAIAAAIAGDHRLRSGNAATVAAEIAHHWQRAGDAPARTGGVGRRGPRGGPRLRADRGAGAVRARAGAVARRPRRRRGRRGGPRRRARRRRRGRGALRRLRARRRADRRGARRRRRRRPRRRAPAPPRLVPVQRRAHPRGARRLRGGRRRCCRRSPAPSAPGVLAESALLAGIIGEAPLAARGGRARADDGPRGRGAPRGGRGAQRARRRARGERAERARHRRRCARAWPSPSSTASPRTSGAPTRT